MELWAQIKSVFSKRNVKFLSLGLLLIFGGIFFLFTRDGTTRFESVSTIQKRDRGTIVIDYGKTTPHIRERVKEWYKDNYQTVHALTGGPCESFSLHVLHEEGGFYSGGGGTFNLVGLGKDSFLRANGPLSEEKNFEHVLSHEFTHAIQNGIWPQPNDINAGPSYIQEGIAEFVSQATLIRGYNETLDERYVSWSYLPHVLESFDSLTLQDAHAELVYWREQGTFNTQLAMALFSFLEDASPGFLKTYHEKLCALEERSISPHLGGRAVMPSLEKMEALISDSFNGTIEGGDPLLWVKKYSVSHIEARERAYLRFDFQKKNTRHTSEEIMGSAINPEVITIHTVKTTHDQFGGFESTDFYPSVETRLVDAARREVLHNISDFLNETALDIEALSLPAGAYKLSAREENGRRENNVYFIRTGDESHGRFSGEKTLYGIIVKGDEIVSTGNVKIDGETIPIKDGVFTAYIKEKEATIEWSGETWEKRIPQYAEKRLVVLRVR